MTTYTLAIGADMLLATVPDGGDIASAVQAEAIKARIDAPPYDAFSGCTLTNIYLPDHDLIWHSGNSGFITDENGVDWLYAIVKPE